jgi:hypothetical protein
VFFTEQREVKSPKTLNQTAGTAKKNIASVAIFLLHSVKKFYKKICFGEII